LYQISMNSNSSRLPSARVAKIPSINSSFVTVAKKLSTTALSRFSLGAELVDGPHCVFDFLARHEARHERSDSGASANDALDALVLRGP
jgi:hypothetical protein